MTLVPATGQATDTLGAMLALALGVACLLAFAGLKSSADRARGGPRFYLIGLSRSVLLACGVVAAMVGLSSLLRLFVR